ncbi:ANR family transcriptional regulator [Shewanella sp. Isolate7]|uniref:ANR family transcriptional regulator n=1 Tax=Shewanella sp. Isolate7 TaxID=2908528 RepID=UPI001EFE81ED|nr:ANR family transcriptional regulator [Shewanella sp. Isolate7]MCG9722137.1 ANR family transcriptional regulator [Shewanella sp. Isolate7]
MKENEIYQAFAEEAAQLERSKAYSAATNYWRKAAPKASLRGNQLWAEHRAELTERLAIRANANAMASQQLGEVA